MKQFIKFIAIHLQMPCRLIDAYLEDVFNFLICEIGCLDKKLGQWCVASNYRNACRFGARRWQWAGKLGRWCWIAADEHHGSRLRPFAQHIDQPVEQIAAECHQLGIGIISLCVALKGEEQALLIGEDTLGLSGKRGLIDFAADLLWCGAYCAQPIKDKRAEL